MKFAIALYGSFKDSAGYAWKLPVGYDQGVFERIKRHFSKSYEDGRRLSSSELYGGYYIDIINDRFLAFRFIDGGEDALGRVGVVVINWAVTQYSGIVGKNIKSLYDRLTMRQMPLGECIDVDFKSEFAFCGNVAGTILGAERVLLGEEACSVFQLPIAKCCRDTLVEFVLMSQQKEASVKFLSLDEKSATSVRKSSTNLRNKRNLCGVLCGLVVLIAVVFLRFAFLIPTPEDPNGRQPGRQINGTLEIWLPGCVWEEEVSAENSYCWGRLRIEGSKIFLVFVDNVSLNEKGRGSSSKEIEFERKMTDDEMRIVFKKDDSRGEHKLSGDYFLIDKKSRKKCALLSVKDENIHFKVFRDNPKDRKSGKRKK